MSFDEAGVSALARAKARELTGKLNYDVTSAASTDDKSSSAISKRRAGARG